MKRRTENASNTDLFPQLGKNPIAGESIWRSLSVPTSKAAVDHSHHSLEAVLELALPAGPRITKGEATVSLGRGTTGVELVRIYYWALLSTDYRF